MSLRATLFIALSTWVWLAPAYRQVLGGTSPYVNRWRMYSGIGLGLLEVKYERASAGGRRERLDHYRVLGYRGARGAPRRVTHLTDLEQARRLGAALCPRLGAGSRVYLTARRAVLEGWQMVDFGSDDLCARARLERAPEAPSE